MTPPYTTISTDTRTIRPGALFVALTGERFDGHDFLGAARDAGAVAAVVRCGTPAVARFELLEVDDPLAEFGRLATARRREVDGPVIAVTGSNGKTTTKELLIRVLATKWQVHGTTANRNNLVGVPQTILAAPEGTQALVVEAGANEPGEIARLRKIIEPTIAVVANVSAGHLAGFGSLPAVLEEKALLARDVPLAVVGARPATLREAVQLLAGRVVTAGADPASDVVAEDVGLDDNGHVRLTVRGQRLRVPLVGRHQAENVALAVAVALELGLDLAQVAAALADVVVPGGRCEVIRHGDLLVLNDTYNSNPESFRASLEAAIEMRGDRPFVAVLGSMLELGDKSRRLHVEAAEAVMHAEPRLVGATGEFVAAFREVGLQPGDRFVVSDDVMDLGRSVKQALRGDEFVLLKASRGVRLERIIPSLTTGDDA
ncbi:MAG: UDP-N-acetylmuramoyl-tripeptide--D-alanyl-D-alanine ligase [Gemmatimonadetes bacterium]|nr:UDP-N-acetylmuramoyl-tripeptide--D-alanyl-D-alanine ligase [Gemmatimonadota bacterium]